MIELHHDARSTISTKCRSSSLDSTTLEAPHEATHGLRGLRLFQTSAPSLYKHSKRCCGKESCSIFTKPFTDFLQLGSGKLTVNYMLHWIARSDPEVGSLLARCGTMLIFCFTYE